MNIQDFPIIKHTLVYLDHIMFLKCNNCNLNNTELGVLQIDITDHFPTVTSISLKNNLNTANVTF